MAMKQNGVCKHKTQRS